MSNQAETWETKHQLGDSLFEQGLFEQAVIAYGDAIALNPDSFWCYHQLASTLIQLQQWQDAVKACRSAIALDSTFPWCYHNLGDALLKLEQWDEAISAYNQALALNINFPWCYYNLAVCLTAKQQWDRAFINFLQAFILDHNLSGIYHQLGEVLPKIDINSQVFNIFELSPEFYLELGTSLDVENKKEAAIALYRLALNIYPNHLEITQQLETLLKPMKDNDDDLSPYYLEIEKNPDSSWSYYNLGTALSRKQKWEESVTAYLHAIKINPDFPWWFYYNIWEVLTQQDKLEEVINLYQNLLQENPDTFWAYLNLGEAFTRQGKIDTAISYYQTVSYKHAIATLQPQAIASRPLLQQFTDKLEPIKAPNFMIIGVQRGGTTSLYSYVMQHPQIVSPIKKEMDFWSWHFHRGINWYLSHFPPIPSGENFITGEASPSYIDHPDAVDRVFQNCPDVKLILLLRNPCDRAISHYYHWRSFNWEYRTLEDAIEDDIQKLKEKTDIIIGEEPGNYIVHGLYIEHLKKWLKLFPREQILIIKSEDLYVETAKTMKQVWQFLGLPEYQLPEYQNSNPGSYSPVDESTRQKLRDYFQPYNKQLEEYLGMKFNWDN